MQCDCAENQVATPSARSGVASTWREAVGRTILGTLLLLGSRLPLHDIPAACAQTPADSAAADEVTERLVYFGTYTARTSRGIYLSRLDLRTGTLSAPQLVAETTHPSFLAWGPSANVLYAVNETGEYEGERTGYLTAFGVDGASGELRELNRMASGGTAPCHLTVDATGQHVLVANYGSGTLGVFSTGDEGRLLERTCLIQHAGSSINPQRQEGPHAHCINLGPDDRWAFSADLGLDRVLVYRFAAETGTLEPADPPGVPLQPGAGPRHLAIHPAGGFAYVINELNSTLVALQLDLATGRLEPLQTVSTLPEGFDGASFTAEVMITPDGKCLYGSNRGHDSLAAFAVNAETGRLTPAGIYATQGKTPRSFGIDPDGQFLLAANQDSDTVVVFRIDSQSGQLQQVGQPVAVPMPVCVLFR